MKINNTKQHPGFTLVEILIVVTIIAILTGITYVAWGGVKDRAYNARIVAGVRQYSEAIKTYKSLNGKYPQTQREIDGEYIALTCLGQGYTDNTCGIVTGHQVYVDETFYTQLGTVLKNTDAPINDASYTVSDESFMGAVYGIDEIGGSAAADAYKGADGRGRTIQYALLGSNADCGIQGAWSYNRSTTPATTACEIGLESIEPRFMPN